MENRERIDQLIEKWQQHAPQLQDGEALTERIMKTVTDRKSVV